MIIYLEISTKKFFFLHACFTLSPFPRSFFCVKNISLLIIISPYGRKGSGDGVYILILRSPMIFHSMEGWVGAACSLLFAQKKTFIEV